MFTVIAYGLAVVLDLLFVFIGARFLLQPGLAATGYGVPAQPSAYLTVKGVRDLSCALLGIALLAFVSAEAAAWFMLVLAIIPLGDMLIVLRNGGTKATAFGVHFATAVVMVISAGLLFAL